MVFSKRGRDPREEYATEPCRILSVSFKAILTDDYAGLQNIKACDDAKTVKWFALDQLPLLAFDHLQIIHSS